MGDGVPRERPADRARLLFFTNIDEALSDLPSGWMKVRTDAAPARQWRFSIPDEGSLKWVFTYVGDGLGLIEFAPEPEPVVMDQMESLRRVMEKEPLAGRIIQFDQEDDVLRSWSFTRARSADADPRVETDDENPFGIVVEGLTLDSVDDGVTWNRRVVAAITTGGVLVAAIAVLLVLGRSPDGPAERVPAAGAAGDAPASEPATSGGGTADPEDANAGVAQPPSGGVAGGGGHHYMSEPYGPGTRAVTIRSGTDWWYEALLGTEPPTLDGGQVVCDYEATLQPADGSRGIPVLDVTGIAETYNPPVQGDLGDLEPGDYELMVDTGPRCGWEISLYAGSAVPRDG